MASSNYVAETPAPAAEAPAAAPEAAPPAEAPAPELKLLAVLEGALPADAAAAAEVKLVAAGFDSSTSLAVLTPGDLQLAGVPAAKCDEIMASLSDHQSRHLEIVRGHAREFAAAGAAMNAPPPEPAPAPAAKGVDVAAKKREASRLVSEYTAEAVDEGLVGPQWEATPWVKPRKEVAQAYGVLTTFEGGALQVSATPVAELGRMGTGVQLYFVTLREMIKLMVCLGVLYLPTLVLNFAGNGHRFALRQAYKDLDPTAPLFSVGLTEFSLANQGLDPQAASDEARLTCDCDCDETRAGWDEVLIYGVCHKASTIAYWVAFVQFAAGIAFLAVAINFIRKVYKVIEEQDDSTASPSDYTIFVRGLPPNATAGAIRDFFSARYDFSSKGTAQPGDVKGLEYPVLGLSVKGVAISSAALVWLVYEIILAPIIVEVFSGAAGLAVLIQLVVSLMIAGAVYHRVTTKGYGKAQPRASPGEAWDEEWTKMLTQRNAALYETGTCASKDKGARVIPSGPDILARDTDVVAPPELLPCDEREGAAEFAGKWVADVRLVHPVGDLIMKFKKRKSLLSAVNTMRGQMKMKKADPKHTAAKEAAMRKKLDKKDEKLTKAKEKMEKSIKDADKVFNSVVGAFVTFEHEEAQKRAIEDYRGFYSLVGLGQFFQPPELQFPVTNDDGTPQLDKKGRPKFATLRVERAPEPSNILWENLELSENSRFVRKWIANSLVGILILASFFGILTCTIMKNNSVPDSADMLKYNCTFDLSTMLGDDDGADQVHPECKDAEEKLVYTTSLTYAMVAGIVVINELLQIFMKTLVVDVKRPLSVSEQTISTTFYTSAAKIVNTALITLIVGTRYVGVMADKHPLKWVGFLYSGSAKHSGASKKWYCIIGSGVTMTMLINVFTPQIAPVVPAIVKAVKRRVSWKSQPTQEAMNDLFEGPEFPIEKMYSVILTTVFVTLLYAGGIPILVWLAVGNLGLTYLLSKYMLIKQWKMPPAYDGKLCVVIAQMLPAMWFIHFAFAIYFLAEDSLLRSDTYNEDIVELLANVPIGSELWSYAITTLVEGEKWHVFPLLVLWLMALSLGLLYAFGGSFAADFIAALASKALGVGKSGADIENMKRQPAFTRPYTEYLDAATLTKVKAAGQLPDAMKRRGFRTLDSASVFKASPDDDTRAMKTWEVMRDDLGLYDYDIYKNQEYKIIMDSLKQVRQATSKIIDVGAYQPQPDAAAAAADQPQPDAAAVAADQPQPDAAAAAADQPQPDAAAAAAQE